MDSLGFPNTSFMFSLGIKLRIGIINPTGPREAKGKASQRRKQGG